MPNPAVQGALREKPRRRLNSTLGVSVVEAQLSYLEGVTVDAIHHAMLVCDAP
jgi:hypothetical protein